ncbi:MAG: helix-hairpin-helix domain-containing protein [Streptococcaceae bacterium]|jgi:competence protein ComEA|nr:helix-hairpin-helix domain-containing protein [Streptococcaceae bacterium]MCH4176843.1 helix-hairpin-helix domain-containing protein [Streptococcaceae bacterium]
MAQIEYFKKYWQYFVSGLAIILIILFFIISQQLGTANLDSVDLADIDSNQTVSKTTESSKAQDDRAEPIQIYVDIKGAVVKPGIYQVSEQLRVADVVQMAGGMIENAEIKGVNLAQKLADEMVIYVPFIGEVIENIAIAQAESGDSEVEDAKVNLNTATEAELQTISGIGEKKSKDIINYRQINGAFQTIEDLKNVSGIGSATIEKIKDYVTIK